jgi:putative protein-disulfide isomerase
MKKRLYYIYDPMCSWCYAFASAFDVLKQHLDDSYEIIYIPGGLAPHNDEVMPQAMQKNIQTIWRDIEQRTQTPFNHDFWTQCTPKRSTYLACQATLAAKQQHKEEAMIHAIQEAYYLKALNPSEKSTLTALASQLHLDVTKFTYDLTSQETVALFEEALDKRRKMGVSSFPTLLLQYKKELYPIPIHYNEPKKMLAHIDNLSQNIYF